MTARKTPASAAPKKAAPKKPAAKAAPKAATKAPAPAEPKLAPKRTPRKTPVAKTPAPVEPKPASKRAPRKAPAAKAATPPEPKPRARRAAATASEKPRLHIVEANETPPAPPVRRLTVIEAAESDDPKDMLLALRDRLARTIDDPNTPARDLAALTRRVQEINRELAAIAERAREEAEGGKPSDDEAWDEEAI